MNLKITKKIYTMNKKMYIDPTMRVVLMKPAKVICDSGGVNSGDKPGDEYSGGDVTYSRQDGWDIDED